MYFRITFKLILCVNLIVCFTNCEDKVAVKCTYYDLCDEVLFCNYFLTADNFYETKQVLNFKFKQYPYFDTLNQQQLGTVLTKEFNFEDGLIINLSKFYNSIEFNGFTREFGLDYSLNVSYIKDLYFEKVLLLYSSPLKSSVFDSVYIHYDHEGGYIYVNDSLSYYEYITDSIGFLNITDGVNVYIPNNKYFWTNASTHLKKFNITQDTLSYFKIRRMYYYKNDFYILEGNFYLKVYRLPIDTKIEIESLTTNYVSGTFKLATKINTDYSNSVY